MISSVTDKGRASLPTEGPTYSTPSRSKLDKKTQNYGQRVFRAIAQFFSRSNLSFCSGEQNTRKSVESERRTFQAQGSGEREPLRATHQRDCDPIISFGGVDEDGQQSFIHMNGPK